MIFSLPLPHHLSISFFLSQVHFFQLKMCVCVCVSIYLSVRLSLLYAGTCGFSGLRCQRMTKRVLLSHAEDAVPRYQVSHWIWSWLVSLSPSNPLVSAPTLPYLAVYEDSGIWSHVPRLHSKRSLSKIWAISSLLPSRGCVVREEGTHVCTFSRVLTNTQRSLPSGFLCALYQASILSGCLRLGDTHIGCLIQECVVFAGNGASRTYWGSMGDYIVLPRVTTDQNLPCPPGLESVLHWTWFHQFLILSVECRNKSFHSTKD